MAKQPRENPKHMTKIGGQALIEGVMMKGADTGAMACRLPNGEIDVETWKENNGKNMPWYRKCPFLRGSFNFVLSMKDGYRCLTKSAEKQVPEDEDEEDTEEMNRFEKWLDEKLGDKLFGIIMSIGMVVGISYEFIRIAGRSNNWLTRALSWPGLQIQRITTREPDASQIECAIAALKPCIPEDMEDDKW